MQNPLILLELLVIYWCYGVILWLMLDRLRRSFVGVQDCLPAVEEVGDRFVPGHFRADFYRSGLPMEPGAIWGVVARPV